MDKNRYIGNLWGAHNGTANLTEDENGNLWLSVRTNFGDTARFRATKAGDAEATLELIAVDTDNNILPDIPGGRFEIQTRDGESFSGIWSLNDGAEGSFRFSRDTVAQQANSLKEADVPTALQLWTKEIPLGAITLSRTELNALLDKMHSLIDVRSQGFILANVNDQDVRLPVLEFLAKKDLPKQIFSLTVSYQEVVAGGQGLKKTINLHLNRDGNNRIVVEAPSEAWSAGIADRLNRYMGDFTSAGTSWLQKHGLNFNTIILVAFLVFMPDLSMLQRVVSLAFVFGIIFSWFRLIGTIPRARIYLDANERPVGWKRQIPTILSGIFVGIAVAALVAAPSIAAGLASIVSEFWSDLAK